MGNLYCKYSSALQFSGKQAGNHAFSVINFIDKYWSHKRKHLKNFYAYLQFMGILKATLQQEYLFLCGGSKRSCCPWRGDLPGCFTEEKNSLTTSSHLPILEGSGLLVMTNGSGPSVEP